jgi:hypothetical protein
VVENRVCACGQRRTAVDHMTKKVIATATTFDNLHRGNQAKARVPNAGLPLGFVGQDHSKRTAYIAALNASKVVDLNVETYERTYTKGPKAGTTETVRNWQR